MSPNFRGNDNNPIFLEFFLVINPEALKFIERDGKELLH